MHYLEQKREHETSLLGSCCTKNIEKISAKNWDSISSCENQESILKSVFRSSLRKERRCQSYTSLHLLRAACFFYIIVLLQATSKRIRRGNRNNSSLNTCAVHIAADHSFFKHVGSGSESATVAEMVYHVAMADKAFRATDFNQDGGPGDDIGFVIAAVTVFKDAEAEGSKIFVTPQISSIIGQ